MSLALAALVAASDAAGYAVNRKPVHYRNDIEMMSLTGLRSQLRRTRRRVAVLAALLAMFAAVAVHHAMPDGAHMAMETGVVCLAVVGLAVVAVSAAIDFLARPRPSWFVRLAVSGDTLLGRPVRGLPARAGPRTLQVLRL